MFKLNLKIALRNLWKNKTYTFINIAGLAVGMAGCIIIFVFIRYQLSYDQQFINKDRIYRVVSYWKYANGEEEYQNGVPRPLAPAMRNDFGMLEEVAALQENEGIVKIKDPSGQVKLKKYARVFYVEPQFFKIFNYTWLQGDPQRDLIAPNTAALSRKMAVRFFGDWRKAIGQTINYKDKADLKVTAVFDDLGDNNSNPVNIAISYRSYADPREKKWGSVSASSECYILLKKGVNIADLEGPKNAFLKKYYEEGSSGKEDHFFQPLAEIHQDGRYGNFANKITSKKEIGGLIVIGVFLLITACINFINLSTAQAISRSKEVGIRKVMGGRRKQLIVQFLTETMTITLIALLFACILTEAALPLITNLFKEKISFNIIQYPVIFLFLAGMVLFIGFLAGFYPALVMSGFNPVLAIKNKISIGNAGGVRLRKMLVIVQFAITIILITGTLVVMMQMKFIREKPLGFNSSAVVLVDVPYDSLSMQKYEHLKLMILKEPGVLSASFCSAAPSSGSNENLNFSFNSIKDANFNVNVKSGDEDYLKTFGLQLIAGKGLAKSDTIKEYIVNETLLKKLHIAHPEDAIGKIISLTGKHQARVAGVVKDFYNKSLREEISPILLYADKANTNTIAIKMDAKQLPEAMKNIERIWNTVYPEHIYEAGFMDDYINDYYESERIMGVLFKIFASVIVFISFIGLFGLISFIAAQRTKEMAIRKVLGASTLELLKMLNKSFVLMVLLSNLIAWPVAYIFISKWLSGYTYRIDLSIWPFVAAMLLSILVTLLTVSLRTYKALSINSADALKYE